MRLQQLFKSTQRKIDDLPDVRKRLARFERERRMGFKLAGKMLESVARNVSREESWAETLEKAARVSK